jgi:hypothetical protein
VAFEASGLFVLAPKEGESEVESFDLTSPVFFNSAFAACDEILLQFVEAGSIFGLMLSIGQRKSR